MSTGWTYAKAGVNIDKKSSAIESLVGELKSKRSGIGQMLRMKNLFASLIDFGDNYLTLATDGVGTKIIVAKELDCWDTIGIDCIAMNVNDTICVGAEPISFVDYVALDKPNEKISQAIGKGLNKGAELSNMEIVGGEIAVLPEIINGIDLSGTCLGYVPKNKFITGQNCTEGDFIVALKSSGIHSNGLTLARKVFEDSGYDMADKIQGLHGTVGMELLTPTEIYVKEVLSILSKHTVHGLVDITGGGLRNILRMNSGFQYVIDDPIKPDPIFCKIQELGGISVREMYQTFNMSMGFDIIAPEADAEAIVKENKNAYVVGRVTKGKNVVYSPENIIYEHY
jgi:phosphoribosylformylglycinamidine cyclo-ligase